MGDFLARLFLLLLPVALLLFASLRLKRRAVFPHTYFPSSRARPTDLLLRSLRLRYDLILDALAAVVVALALAALPPAGPGRIAAVIDGSRSMLRGEAGSRPMDRSVEALYARADLEKARVFLLDYDARRGRYRLRDFTSERKSDDAKAFAGRLSRESQALGADWDLLARLRKRGYGRVVVFTDSLPGEPSGFEAVESGMPDSPYAYPASAGYEESTASWTLRLVVEGLPSGLIVHRWEDISGSFIRLANDQWDLSEGPYGWILRFPRPGLVLVTLAGEAIPILLPPRPARPEGTGEFSRAMASVFSFLPERPGDGLLFSDAPGAGSEAVITSLVSEDTPLLADPGETYGGFIPLAASDGRRIALGRGSLDAADLPLLFWSRIQAALPPPYYTDPGQAGPGWKPIGSGFYRITPEGPRVLLPPIGEYAPVPSGAPVRIPEPEHPRWPYALLLAVLYALKLVLRRSFSSLASEGEYRAPAADSLQSPAR